MSGIIKMYALLSCGHCRDAKEFFSENKIEYQCVNVDLLLGEEKSDVLKELKEINPHLSFPTILIGDQVIVGFKKEEIKKILHLK